MAAPLGDGLTQAADAVQVRVHRDYAIEQLGKEGAGNLLADYLAGVKGDVLGIPPSP